MYVSGTQPATPGDIGEYDVAGFSTNLSFSRTRNMVDASNKDSGDDSEFEAGRRTSTITGTFFADITDDADAGQAAIETAINDADGNLVYWLITDNILGNRQYHGSALPSQFDLSWPDEGMVQIEVTLQVTGSFATEAVT